MIDNVPSPIELPRRDRRGTVIGVHARGDRQEAPASEFSDDQQKMLDLVNKGMDFERADKPVEAERIYRRWIEEATKRYGADGLITSLGYRLLAGSLETQNRLKEAEPLWKRLLDINRAQLGEDDDETLTAYMFLSSNYVKQGRPGEALPLRRAILAKRMAQRGDKDAKTIIATANLAAVLSELGEMKEAETLFRKALATSLRGEWRKAWRDRYRLQQSWRCDAQPRPL